MNRTGPKTASKPATGKALLVTAALLLGAIALVFLNKAPAENSVALLTPTPTLTLTPSPTPVIGVREAVAMERLSLSAVVLGEAYDDGRIPLTLPAAARTESDAQGVLELAIRAGYVRGFTLELDMPAEPVQPKAQSEYEQGIYAGQLLRYQMDMEGQRRLMHELLSLFLAMLDTRAEVPPGRPLLWESSAQALTEAGGGYSDELGGFTFVATRSYSGKLLISLSV